MEKLKKEIQSVVDIYKSRDLLKAEALTKELISKNPNIAFLYNLLGLILVDQEKIEEALKHYNEGLKKDKNFSMLYNNLGILYFRHKNDKERARDYYKKAIEINNKLAEPFNNLGTLFNSQNKTEDAVEQFKKAIKVNPKFSFAHLNIGSIYISLGKFTEARKHLNEAVSINPNLYVAHRLLSRITKYTENNEHLKRLEQIYKHIKKDEEEKNIEMSFALGKIYEDIKKYQKSFSCYKTGNDLVRKKVKFSIDDQKEIFKEIINTYDKNLFNKYKDYGCKDLSTIFIVGMPRSGTTLIEQILSSHPDVFGGDELDLIPNLINKNFGGKNPSIFFKGVTEFNMKDLEKIGSEYIKSIKKISNNSKRITDKLPVNFLNIGFIKLILPNSKIVHCHRNLKDNCFSIYKNLFTSGRITFAYDLNETIEYYQLYKNLMDYWNDVFKDKIYNIKYENLINDTKLNIETLLKYCNLSFNDKCLNFHENKRKISTASDFQARNKIHKGSIESWRRYEIQLEKYFKNISN